MLYTPARVKRFFRETVVSEGNHRLEKNAGAFFDGN
jgi:hypothetical protein